MGRILIAVKSEILAAALTDILSQYAICVCHTGPDAMAQINTVRPDVLLIELSLPFVSGISVVKESAYRPAVVIGLTTLLSPGVICQAKGAGFHYLASIPVDLAEITKLVETAIKTKLPSPGV